MILRNILCWQLDEAIRDAMDNVELEPFTPCGAPPQEESAGWDPILDGADYLRRDLSGATFLRARHQVRSIPAGAVAERMAERVAETVARTGSQPRGAAWRRELRDDAKAELLATAPLVSTRRWLCVDHEHGLVIVDTATASAADAVLSLLRASLGSLPVRPLAFHRPLDSVLTAWVATGRCEADFRLGRACDLQHPMDTSNSVRIRGQELDEDEVQALIDRGMRVRALQLLWDVDAPEPVQFTLTDQGAFRAVRVPWEVGGDIETGHQLSALDADLTLAVLSLRRIWLQLFPALGGRISA